eukprot:m.1362933 g.1362933  ORF g.1362933 m.1362933 type:complete len:653 (-) comp24944_c0_seq26:3678-5636(-)
MNVGSVKYGHTPLFSETGKPCASHFLTVIPDSPTDESATDNALKTLSGSSISCEQSSSEEQEGFERQMALLARQIDRMRQECSDDKQEKKIKDHTLDPDTKDDTDESESDEDDDEVVTRELYDLATSTHVQQDIPDHDSSTVVDIAKSGPLVRFRARSDNGTEARWLAVYRAILPDKGDGDVSYQIRNLTDNCRWGIFMCHGGDFAGAISHNGKLTHHKCFHRYVVRAKRGTVQSVQDKKSATSQPHSAGASLRRYNEVALKEDIHALIKKWETDLNQCKLIFIHTPMHSRGLFFSAKSGALVKGDPRVRTIPFPTKKPTLKEIRRILIRLAAVYYDVTPPPVVSEPVPISDGDEKRTETEASKPIVQVVNKDDDVKTAGYVDSALFNHICEARYGAAKEYIAQFRRKEADTEQDHSEGTQTQANVSALDDTDTRSINYSWNHGARTALHAAAALGTTDGHDLVHILLQHGADPTIISERRQTPYEEAPDKETRNIFRRFMAQQPDSWNYAAAKIPSPLTAEMETKQEARAKAERKKQRDRMKMKDKLKAQARLKEEEADKIQRAQAAADRAKQDLVEEKRRREKAMTPRQRAAAAAMARHEQQQRVAKARAETVAQGKTPCAECGAAVGKNGFERLAFEYCTVECMKNHKP